MAWTEINAAALLPGATQAVLRAAGDTAATVADVSDTIADGIDVISDFLIDVTDPARAAIQEMVDALKALVSDIENTGIYLYWDTAGLPYYKLRQPSASAISDAMDIDSVEAQRRGVAEAAGEEYPPPQLPLMATHPYGFTGWLARWKDSFDDQGDDRRPIFSDTAEVSALLFIGGTPSLDQLPALLAALGRLLGIKEFTRLLDLLAFTTLARDADAGDGTVYVQDANGFRDDHMVIVAGENGALEFVTARAVDQRTGSLRLYDGVSRAYPAGTPVALSGSDPRTRAASRRPDWHSAKMRDIPPVRDVSRAVKQIVGLIEQADGLLGLVQELADALHENAEQLRDVADLIEQIIETIAAIIALSGVYIVKVDSTTGTAGLFDALDAVGPPALPDRSYVFGACILAGTADLGPIAALFGA